MVRNNSGQNSYLHWYIQKLTQTSSLNLQMNLRRTFQFQPCVYGSVHYWWCWFFSCDSTESWATFVFNVSSFTYNFPMAFYISSLYSNLILNVLQASCCSPKSLPLNWQDSLEQIGWIAYNPIVHDSIYIFNILNIFMN